MRFKKDKSTGLPQLPEGWGPWEVYEEKLMGGFLLPRLRIRLNVPVGPPYERDVLGGTDPIRLHRSDIRRAAKKLLKKALETEFHTNYKSPFIGVYPPKSL